MNLADVLNSIYHEIHGKPQQPQGPALTVQSANGRGLGGLPVQPAMQRDIQGSYPRLQPGSRNPQINNVGGGMALQGNHPDGFNTSYAQGPDPWASYKGMGTKPQLSPQHLQLLIHMLGGGSW